MMNRIYLIFFIVFLITNNLFSQPTTKIYYSQYEEAQRHVFQSNLDGSNEDTLTFPLRPAALAVDWKSNPQKLYVGLKSSTGLGKIIRCDIDGNNQEDVITDLIAIDDIELDLLNRKIYWAQDTYDDDKIYKADMDGLNSSIQPIYSSTTTNRDLWGIALDVASYRMWFTERGGNCYSSYIKRMSMDGSNLTTIITPVCNPHDIEYFGGKIYWGDEDGLESANTDGSDLTIIVTSVKADGLAIDATNHRIYWVDYIYRYVKRVDFDGSNEMVVSGGHNLLSKIDTDYNPAITNVKKEDLSLTSFKLFQNYPNPFNPSTIINYVLARSGKVTIKITDVLGREMTILVNEELVAGKHEIIFDASRFSSGVYFYQIIVGNFMQTKKMILLK